MINQYRRFIKQSAFPLMMILFLSNCANTKGKKIADKNISNVTTVIAQGDKVEINKNADGLKLSVNGKDLIINGMNWDYFPIGKNYTYILWEQPDSIIQKALDNEMPLLKNMDVNAIRVYSGIPKKWIEYIYTNYGIYTMINHTFGRYGLTLNGKWVSNTDYSDALTRELLLKEVKQLATESTLNEEVITLTALLIGLGAIGALSAITAAYTNSRDNAALKAKVLGAIQKDFAKAGVQATPQQIEAELAKRLPVAKAQQAKNVRVRPMQ